MLAVPVRRAGFLTPGRGGGTMLGTGRPSMRNLGIAVIAFAIALIYQRLTRRQRASQARASIKNNLAKVYGQRHEYREVDAASFDWLDLGFYHATLRRLEGFGFRKLADKEDVTLSAIYPSLRTFVRVMVSADSTILGDCYHGKIRGWWAVPAALFGIGPFELLRGHAMDCRSGRSLRNPPGKAVRQASRG
jgi:hypothetical protein